MKYSLFYPTPLSEIKDIENDNIDVCVTTEGGQYTFVVATIDNLRSSAWHDKRGFVKSSAPVLLVDRLEKDIIELLISQVVSDPVLIKMYGSDIE